MRFRPARFLRPAAAAAAFLQLVFALAASVPNMAWCHRPGGEIVLEFEVASGVCPFIQGLPHPDSPAAAPDRTAGFRASHPIHNEIDSEAGRSASSLLAPSNAAPAGAVAALRPDLPDPAPSGLSPQPDRAGWDAGPSGAGILRC